MYGKIYYVYQSNNGDDEEPINDYTIIKHKTVTHSCINASSKESYVQVLIEDEDEEPINAYPIVKRKAETRKQLYHPKI